MDGFLLVFPVNQSEKGFPSMNKHTRTLQLPDIKVKVYFERKIRLDTKYQSTFLGPCSTLPLHPAPAGAVFFSRNFRGRGPAGFADASGGSLELHANVGDVPVACTGINMLKFVPNQSVLGIQVASRPGAFRKKKRRRKKKNICTGPVPFAKQAALSNPKP